MQCAFVVMQYAFVVMQFCFVAVVVAIVSKDPSWIVNTLLIFDISLFLSHNMRLTRHLLLERMSAVTNLRSLYPDPGS